LAGGSEKRTLYNYFQAHSPYPQVLLFNVWLRRWRYMLNRWAFHNADFFRSPLTVRSCPACAKEDIEATGFAWFRRLHQLPGVDWCLHHSHPLHTQPARLDLLHKFNLGVKQAPVKSGTRGVIPPFIHRYTHAITWLARSSKNPENEGQLTNELDRIEYDEQEPRAAAPRLLSAPTSIAPMDWYRAHFEDPSPVPYWAFDITDRFTTPRIALRAATLTRTVDELESLMTRVVPSSERETLYSIDSLERDLDLDEHYRAFEHEEIDRYRWPNSWVPNAACVGLGEKSGQLK
jgi:hypothetical protein